MLIYGDLYYWAIFHETFVATNSQGKLQEIMLSAAVPRIHSFNFQHMYLEVNKLHAKQCQETRSKSHQNSSYLSQKSTVILRYM